MNILVFNPGSSSLKFGFYEVADASTLPVLQPWANGHVERIGTADAQILWGGSHEARPLAALTPAQATKEVIKLLGQPGEHAPALTSINAVGCRVVHGGDRFAGPELITDRVLRDIRDLIALAPLHNASDAEVIETVCAAFPRKPVVAVFDTAFHRTLPAVAFTYALPVELAEHHHLRRYGFHGIAHQYVSGRLSQKMGRRSQGSRLVTCHLGSGASICALRDGESIDTSMGLTPLEGLVMGTRSGDLDPGLIQYLLRTVGMTATEVEDLLNRQSGLRGLMDGGSSDVRDIAEAAANGDRRAQLALEIFCYRVMKYIGAYAAVLEGLDAVAFSGGIGEHSPKLRARILRRLRFLGLTLDENRNASADGSAEAALHSEASDVQAWLIPANENIQIAQEVQTFLKSWAAG